MNWTWEENSILYNISEYMPPKDIFQAVCNELGRYFSLHGAKYTKSNKKLKWNGKKVRCEMGLWSSHSNIQGDWVNLEIVTSVYAINAKGMEKKGLLKCDIRPEHFNVYKLDVQKFGEIIQYIDNTLKKVWDFEEKLEDVKVFNNCVIIGRWQYNKPDLCADKNGEITLVFKSSFGPCEVWRWTMDAQGRFFMEYKWCEDDFFEDESFKEEVTKDKMIEEMKSMQKFFAGYGLWEYVEAYKAAEEKWLNQV